MIRHYVHLNSQTLWETEMKKTLTDPYCWHKQFGVVLCWLDTAFCPRYPRPSSGNTIHITPIRMQAVFQRFRWSLGSSCKVRITSEFGQHSNRFLLGSRHLLYPSWVFLQHKSLEVLLRLECCSTSSRQLVVLFVPDILLLVFHKLRILSRNSHNVLVCFSLKCVHCHECGRLHTDSRHTRDHGFLKECERQEGD